MKNTVGKKQPPVTPQEYKANLKKCSTATNDLNKLNAEKAKELAAINDKYDKKIEAAKQKSDESFAIVQRYCVENRKELFTEAKSIETSYGLLGFRDGKDAVKLCEGITMKEVLERMKKNRLKGYIRTKEELDKVLIIKDKDKLENKLEAVGLEIGKGETFFFQPA